MKQSIEDAGGIKATSAFQYDVLGQPSVVTDPKSLKTTYQRNGLGELLALTSPDTGSTGFTYDDAGNVLSRKDAANRQATYTYDALNRPVSVSYADAALETRFVYDVAPAVCVAGEQFAAGRLASMKDGSGTTQYCYNRFGDLVRKVQTTNGKALTVRYAYTAGGRLTSMVYPDGAMVDYVRNELGQVAEVGYTAPGGSREVLVKGATYLPMGPVDGWTYGNGRVLTRAYDQDYRPKAIQDKAVGGLDVGFGFDEVGNLTSLTPAGNPTPEIGLGYDTLGRLTALTDGVTGTVIDGYSYDATGNRLSAKVGSVTQAYTYPTTNHRLSAVAGVARTYDKTGNTLSIGGKAREFPYDASGRMSMVKRAGVLVMNYRYNGKGEQVRRFLGTTNTYTLYDEAGHWLGDYDNNGAPKQQAIWLDDLPVGLLANANKLHYIEPDHLGSPRVVVDPVRNVAAWSWSLKGEAFGNTAPNQDPDGDGAALVLDMRFPGQRFDAASGLNQNYFRDYDSATGRYGQSDPIGLGGGLSTFGYVGGSPLYLIDPLGLESGTFQFGQYRMKQPEFESGANRGGATAMKILSSLNSEMKSRNIAGSDQFYHCLASCRATQATKNPSLVLEMMALKETKDYYAGRLGLYGDGRRRGHYEMQSDNQQDMAANQLGATCQMGEDCPRRCMGLVPERSRPFLSNYIPEWGQDE
ncbi:RHS repeat-associated core domain-containing protein [Xanthomonas campestris pv. campestris]|nr:RHS repeat-associated core domain-containing protein [Xanthomonas campestris pv. campestris]